MSTDRNTRISKFLAMVLRHKPEIIGITLDEAGWVDVEVLVAALARHGKAVSHKDLAHVVASNDKKRFAFSEDGRRIRASQGHSVQVNLGLAPAVPPEVLYHGTADRSVPAIRLEGLVKRQRQHVHLSTTRETAIAVGVRHGRPVVLEVRAGEMHRSGMTFFLSDNGVWLTDAVPPAFIAFPA